MLDGDRTKRLLEEEEDKEFTAQVRKMLATQNPNPERIDCELFSADIKALAWHKELRNDLEAVLEHIFHCSPCFDDHRRHKRQFRLFRRTLKIGLPAAAALLLLSSGLSLVWISKGRPSAKNADLAAPTLNLNLGVRGADESSNGALEIGRDHQGPLAIELPKGSRAGKYLVKLGLANRPLVQREGTAAIDHHGSTILTLSDFSLTGIQPGTYDLAITRPPLDWVHFTVRVR
jgi:hypothetical protein